MSDEPRDEARTSSRRQVLKGAAVLGGLGALAAGGVALWRSDDDGRTGVNPDGSSDRDARADREAGADGDISAGDGDRGSSLDTLADAITSGGPGKDGIPSIDEPRFVAADRADFLADDEPVFGLTYSGDVRAYPQLVLVWHEIVNDTIAGQPMSVTYCPLTGTVIGFTGVRDGPTLTFGTTGNLVNSNLLMYDRETDSEWPQLLGMAIRGEHKGSRLATVPLVWSTWKAWRSAHPSTVVLSTETGAARQYGSDPYGSYPGESGYYVEGDPFFPVTSSDDRFGPKEVVLGIRVDQSAVAVHRELIRRERSVPVTVSGHRLTAVWDDDLATIRVAAADGASASDGAIGDGVDVLDSMWFAWYAFHPDTEVLR